MFVTEDIVDRNLVLDADQARTHEVTTLGWRVLAGTDIEIGIEQVVASSEQVAVRATATGTQCESLWTSRRPAARSRSTMHGSAGSITGKSRRFGRCRMASVLCSNLTPSLNYRRTARRLSTEHRNNDTT